MDLSELMGIVFLAARDGGMRALTAMIEAADNEAAETDRAIAEMDEANEILDQAIEEMGLEGNLGSD